MDDVMLKGLGDMAGHMCGRGVDFMHAEREVRALQTGYDFRDIRYRREVFTRFYLFHLAYRAHPGCVYYLMPWLADFYRWDLEQKLWYAFINGCTQHPVTSLVIFREFPEVPRSDNALRWMTEWFNKEWARLPFDTDRRYQKKEFPRAVETYAAWLGTMSQGNRFGEHMMDRDPMVNFDASWKLIQSPCFWGFGRLSTWSYLEYLFIIGMPLEPSSMMLRDMDGSKSHRNGLAKVLGRDDLDWVKGGPFQGKYSKQVLEWLEKEADVLLEEVRVQARAWTRHPPIDLRHVSRFTFESALCTFKGWFRPNRRYPNVYNDMLHDRIMQVQKLRPEDDLDLFWQARLDSLPHELLLEENPTDPGLQRPKQNHFRLIGEVPMMSLVWPVFKHNETWRTTP